MAGLGLRGCGWGVAGLGLRGCGAGCGWGFAGLIFGGWGAEGVLSNSPSRLGDGIFSCRRHSAHCAKWVSTTSCSMLPRSIELVRTSLRM